MPSSPVALSGTIRTFGIVMGQTAFATGESVVFNVLKNGASILTTTITLNSATATASFINEFGDVATTAVSVGDEYTASGVYVAGSTPANPDFSIVFTWG